MSEFQPVSTKAELESLDEDDILAGYVYGLDNTSEPGNDKSRGFWHGWRNAMIDKGRLPIDYASTQLACEVVGKYRGLN